MVFSVSAWVLIVTALHGMGKDCLLCVGGICGTRHVWIKVMGWGCWSPVKRFQKLNEWKGQLEWQKMVARLSAPHFTQHVQNCKPCLKKWETCKRCIDCWQSDCKVLCLLEMEVGAQEWSRVCYQCCAILTGKGGGCKISLGLVRTFPKWHPHPEGSKCN